MSDFFAQADQLLNQHYPSDGPGAAVLIKKGDQVLLRKGYGMANLELGVTVAPEHIFRLGSITKQFTAVSILMLAAEGKLDVQDELIRFLPDFPARGEKITIEHLLTHTSGIPSYTDQPEWLSMWRKDMTPAEIAALTEDKPLAFKPGEKFQYSNTGYILLGMIIEKISGVPYAQFLQERIFEPAGMTHSLYDDPLRLVPGRASGYSRSSDQVINAPYLSMTQPYAAGALASTVDDLAAWNEALHSGKLLDPAWLARAFVPYRLADGRPTGYGYGWAISTYEEWTFIEHGGGINGFLTSGLACPSEQLYVALLTNSDSQKVDPGFISLLLAGLALGRPYKEPETIEVPREQLEEYCGVYKISENTRRYITLQEAQLFSQRTGGEKLALAPIGTDWFYIKATNSRIHFVRDTSGALTGMELVTRFGPPEPAEKVDELLPLPRQAIVLDASALPNYVGDYELAPGLNVSIRVENGTLQARFPGPDEWVDLLAEDPTTLFITQADLTVAVAFPAGGGRASSVTVRQGEQVYPCKRK